jgi:1-acyl-sn-glycerol-3-phosphate acyltransferase
MNALPDQIEMPEASFGAKAVSVVMWAAGLAWLIPMLGSMMVLNQLVHPHRTEWLSRLYCRGQLFFTGCKWSAVVHPDIDINAVYMFAQNHTNHFDHVVLYNATPHFKQGVELEDHFSIPFYGWFMKSRGTIPVVRGQKGQPKRIMDHMRSELAHKHSILAFPEGTRTTTGRVNRFRKGMFLIARDLGLPIVPVTVTGMYDVMRKGSWVIRPGQKVTVYCDKPIPTAGLTDDELPALAAEVQRVVAARIDAYWLEKQS